MENLPEDQGKGPQLEKVPGYTQKVCGPILARHGITRRNLLLGGGALLGLGIFAWQKKRQQPSPEVPLVPELLTPRQAIQEVVARYNEWFASPAVQTEDADGIEIFVTIYSQIHRRVKDKVFPTLSRKDFDSPDVLSKLHAISDLLNEEQYFVRIIPADGHVSIISGQIVSDKSSVAARRDKTVHYRHIVIDKEDLTHSSDRYCTSVTEVSAFTYRRTPYAPIHIVQLGWAYDEMAKIRYERMMGEPREDIDYATNVVLGGYRDTPKSEALADIRNRTMRNSFVHEEQHALDSFPSDTEQFGLSAQHLMARRIFEETRALLWAVASEDPKMGLLNIFMWKYQSKMNAMNAMIASGVEKTLQIASGGKDLRMLILLPEQQVRTLAAKTFDATDALFQAAEAAKYDLQNPDFLKADEHFLDELETIARTK